VDLPYIRIEDTGEAIPLRDEVTTIGRGLRVDVRLDDPSVSRLHAEIVRRGPYFYLLTFGSARCRIMGLPAEEAAAEVEQRRSTAPELTKRELDVLIALCRPALSDDAFITPATAKEIASDMTVTEAAVKQHLLRLYGKFRVPEGVNRRARLANLVISLGLVRPLADYGSGQVQHAHGVAQQRPLDGVERPAE
jgi:hypothetical protein